MIEYLTGNALNAQVLTGTFNQADLRTCNSAPIPINVNVQKGYFSPLFMFLKFNLSNLTSLNHVEIGYAGNPYIAQFPVGSTGVIYQTVHHPVNSRNLNINDICYLSGNNDDAGLLGSINYRIYYVQIDYI